MNKIIFKLLLCLMLPLLLLTFFESPVLACEDILLLLQGNEALSEVFFKDLSALNGRLRALEFGLQEAPFPELIRLINALRVEYFQFYNKYHQSPPQLLKDNPRFPETLRELGECIGRIGKALRNQDRDLAHDELKDGYARFSRVFTEKRAVELASLLEELIVRLENDQSLNPPESWTADNPVKTAYQDSFELLLKMLEAEQEAEVHPQLEQLNRDLVVSVRAELEIFWSEDIKTAFEAVPRLKSRLSEYQTQRKQILASSWFDF